MGKRSNYPREPRDFYRTIDKRAVPPLLKHIRQGSSFIEPCAGAGDLVNQLVEAGMQCNLASDVAPQSRSIFRFDALNLRVRQGDADHMITNPMWRRDFLHALIEKYAPIMSTWLLFDSDWAFTKQAGAFMDEWCTDFVAVGRLRWFAEDDPRQKDSDPKDNCAWYRFAPDKWGATRFWGRI